MSDPRLQQAIEAAQAGQQAESHALLLQIVRENPDNERAWLWLAGLVPTSEQRLDCLKQVLRINPSNQQAARAMAELAAQATTGPTIPLAESATTPAAATNICPPCGSANKPEASFCAACGAPLGQAGAAAPADQPPASVSSPPGPSSRPSSGPAGRAASSSSGGESQKATQCEMIIGFLVPRRCDSPALAHCKRCGRSYCDEHLEVTRIGPVCLACQQGLTSPIALAATASTYNEQDMLVFAAASTWDDDDDDSLFSDLS